MVIIYKIMQKIRELLNYGIFFRRCYFVVQQIIRVGGYIEIRSGLSRLIYIIVFSWIRILFLYFCRVVFIRVFIFRMIGLESVREIYQVYRDMITILVKTSFLFTLDVTKLLGYLCRIILVFLSVLGLDLDLFLLLVSFQFFCFIEILMNYLRQY